ncbi:hypothetical protein [Sinorhizobium meliloti]|uniref:hypothetical protein n=1 Tax=Rhizobium meliloti TaxID=382 RepID=UPI003F14807D
MSDSKDRQWLAHSYFDEAASSLITGLDLGSGDAQVVAQISLREEGTLDVRRIELHELLRDEANRLTDIEGFCESWKEETAKADLGQIIGSCQRGRAAIEAVLSKGKK